MGTIKSSFFLQQVMLKVNIFVFKIRVYRIIYKRYGK